MPACPTACLTLSNRSYITVNGGKNGVIQNTANGTGMADSVGDTGVEADPCTGCRIENLAIRNIYVRTSDSDTSTGASDTQCLAISGSNVTIAHNTMAYAHWCVYVNENNRMDRNLRFYGNNISNTDHGIALAFYNNPGGPGLGPFYFYDNHVHDYAAWDTGAMDAYHHDGFHCYHSQTSGSDVPYIGGGLYIYDNVWGGNVGQNDTAQVYIEGGSTACATPNSPIYLFNNVVTASQFGDPTNDYLTLSAGTEYILNNTVLGGGGSCLVYNADSSTATVENNLISDCRQEISNTGEINGPMHSDYNLFAEARGANTYVCDGHFFAPSRFASWRACIHGDRHSRQVRQADVTATGSLRPGSPALGRGLNLALLCRQRGLRALCSTIRGRRRPRVGAWHVGAY